MQKTSKKNNSILLFFILIIVFSIPFWILGGLTKIQLMPGLPIDTFMIVCPVTVALILAYRENGKQGMIQLLKRGIDVKNVKPGWLFVTILLLPLISIFAFFWLRLSGTMVPVPDIKVIQVLAYILLFFLGALCEELGWSGYLTDPIQSRFGALNAAILIGLFWAVYHWIALLHVNHSIDWIFWWSIGTVAYRIIIVWLYNNTGGSVFIASLFHMTINLTWQLFPINGSYYSPEKTSILLIIEITKPPAMLGRIE